MILLEAYIIKVYKMVLEDSINQETYIQNVT